VDALAFCVKQTKEIKEMSMSTNQTDEQLFRATFQIKLYEKIRKADISASAY
jgi:hypothetical protein